MTDGASFGGLPRRSGGSGGLMAASAGVLRHEIGMRSQPVAGVINLDNDGGGQQPESLAVVP